MRKSLFIIFLFGAFHSFCQNVELSVQTGHSSTINKVIFSPNDELIVSAGADHKIVIWDILTGKQYGVFLGHDESVTDIAFSADGKTLYSVSLDSTLKIWDFENEVLKESIPVDQPVGALQLDDANNRVIMVGEHVCTYNIETGECSEMEFHAEKLFTSIDISDDASMVAIGGEAEKIHVSDRLKKCSADQKICFSGKGHSTGE